MFITSPDSPLSYIIMCLLSISFLFQSVALEGFFSKNIPKEVRGVLVSFLGFCGLIGRAIVLKLGGQLFGVGKAYPFVVLSVFNVVLLLLLLVTMFFGLLGRPAPSLDTIAKKKRVHREKKKRMNTTDL